MQMNKNPLPNEFYAVVQMICQDSKRWPLRLVKLKQSSNGYCLAEYMTGFYWMLAVFLSKDDAEKCRRKLMQCRYEPNPSGWRPYRITSREQWTDILTELRIVEDPNCIYIYQKDKESFQQWLKRQRP